MNSLPKTPADTGASNLRGSSAEELLQVESLSLSLQLGDLTVSPIDEISFALNERETVCLVGESGSGKSLTALSIMRLIDYEATVSYGGDIKFAGESLLKKSQSEMTQIRGSDIAMIPQEPMTALNPVLRIGKQLEQVGLYHLPRWRHRGTVRKEYSTRAEKALSDAGINNSREVMRRFPHQLSGGMLQRVMIAMALIAEPKLIIADEPTTALDVTTQAQILKLLRELQDRTRVALLLITHDLAVAAQVADRIVVMYAGKIVEEARSVDLFAKPLHPYTAGLLASIPSIDGARGGSLRSIDGSVPSLGQLPPGCRFAPRCSYATDICRVTAPVCEEICLGTSRRIVSCWHAKALL